MLRRLRKVPECHVVLLVDLRCAHVCNGNVDDEIVQMKKVLEIECWKLNEIVEFFLLQVLYEMYKLNLNLTIELIVAKGTHGISVVSKWAKIQSVILFWDNRS